jgi:hypothetical protein
MLENGNCEDTEDEIKDRNDKGCKRGLGSMHFVVKDTANTLQDLPIASRSIREPSS